MAKNHSITRNPMEFKGLAAIVMQYWELLTININPIQLTSTTDQALIFCLNKPLWEAISLSKTN